MSIESAKTTVRKSGNSVVVRLPKGYHLPVGEAMIRRVGEGLVIHAVSADKTERLLENLEEVPAGLFADMEEVVDAQPGALEDW